MTYVCPDQPSCFISIRKLLRLTLTIHETSGHWWLQYPCRLSGQKLRPDVHQLWCKQTDLQMGQRSLTYTSLMRSLSMLSSSMCLLGELWWWKFQEQLIRILYDYNVRCCVKDQELQQLRSAGLTCCQGCSTVVCPLKIESEKYVVIQKQMWLLAEYGLVFWVTAHTTTIFWMYMH